MPMFACLFHIKEQLTHSLSYTSEGKHSLYFADLSLSPSFIPPFLSEPRKGALIHSPRNKPGGLRTTHRAVQGALPDSLSFPPAAFPLSLPLTVLYGHSFSIIPSSSLMFPHFTSSQPRQRGRAKVLCLLLRVSISPPAACSAPVCLNVLM